MDTTNTAPTKRHSWKSDICANCGMRRETGSGFADYWNRDGERVAGPLVNKRNASGFMRCYERTPECK